MLSRGFYGQYIILQLRGHHRGGSYHSSNSSDPIFEGLCREFRLQVASRCRIKAFGVQGFRV